MAPILNDVATDLDDLPRFEGTACSLSAEKRNQFDASFREPIRAHYASLQTLVLPVSPAAAWPLAKAAASKMPRFKVEHENEAGGVLEGVAVTRVLRFRDDWVVRLRPGEDGASTKVDMRSKSRLGKGDLGANAARIEAFFAELKRQAAAK